MCIFFLLEESVILMLNGYMRSIFPGQAYPKSPPQPVAPSDAKPEKPGRLALGIGVSVEATVSLTLTNARFNTQRNAVLGVTKHLNPADYLKCAGFFIPARLVQFFSMVEAKEQGKHFSHHMFPSASPLTHDLWGAAFSTVVGLPFSLPMEIVLIKGIQAGHEKQPFMLLKTVKESVMDTLNGNIRGKKATLLRDMPYGACALALPEFLENTFQVTTAGWSDTVKKPGFSLMAAFLYAGVTHPADVVKTAIQNNPKLPESVSKVVAMIVKERGWGALSAGFFQRYAKIGFTFVMLNSIVPALNAVIGRR